MIWKILIAFVLGFIFFYGSGNVDYVKTQADTVLTQNGYTKVAYLGYQLSEGVGRYGLGDVHYTVKIPGNDKALYKLFLYRWGDEIHIYNIRPLTPTTNIILEN